MYFWTQRVNVIWSGKVAEQRESDAETDEAAVPAEIVPPTITFNPGRVGARAAVAGRAIGFAENPYRAVSSARAIITGDNKITRNNFLNILFPLLYALILKARKALLYSIIS